MGLDSDPVSSDPLEGLLPAGDPFEPVAVTVASEDREANSTAMPPGLFGTPATPIANQPIAKPLNSDSVAAPVVRQTKRRRRNRSSITPWILGFLTAGMLSVIGLLAYFVFSGSGKVEIVKSGNKITVSTDQNRQPKLQINQARPTDRRPQSTPPRMRDPVMGNLVGTQPDTETATFGQPSGILLGSPETDSDIKTDQEPNAPMTEQSPPESTATVDVPITSVEVPMMALSDQQEALEKVRQLIRQSDWGKMKVAAESLTEKQLSPENKSIAQALFELTDLATYYREGIKNAVDELEVGNDFEVVNSLRVIVVETGKDLLVVRYNKKSRSLTFDEFPFSLAHKLATFQIPSGPTGEAAKAVYQAVAPKATDAHRDEAVRWLQAIEGEVEGADPQRLAQTIESVYQAIP